MSALALPTQAFNILQRALLSDLGLILVGYALANRSKLDQHVFQNVEKLVYYVLFPTLLFRSIVQSPLDLSNSGYFISASLLLAIILIALSYAVAYIPLLNRHFDKKQWAASAQIGFRFNSILVISLCERLGGGKTRYSWSH